MRPRWLSLNARRDALVVFGGVRQLGSELVVAAHGGNFGLERGDCCGGEPPGPRTDNRRIQQCFGPVGDYDGPGHLARLFDGMSSRNAFGVAQLLGVGMAVDQSAQAMRAG